MIEFIKEYGITNLDYDYIMHNVKMSYIELMSLTENSIREILNYYNSLGLTHEISEIIVKRPDLIMVSKETLEELLSKIDRKVFINIVTNNIEDLILLGI